jgi:hypothetical protein
MEQPWLESAGAEPRREVDMGKTYEQIPAALADWIRQQHLFFVATAPLSAQAHVNCSPKGLDAFRILGPNRVAYVDLTGSGAETIAHVRENGRIVFMFCAFAGPPNIVRLHGQAQVITPRAAEWAPLMSQFPEFPSARAIICADITRVSDSCGYSVPRYDFKQDRDTMARWVENKGVAALPAYRRQKNLKSIDGLPALGADEV